MSQNFFFYDENIRKWMLQVIRLFSEFTVQYGLDSNGTQLYSTVPVIYGDATFSAATIARLNTENTMASFPMISIYVSNLKFDRPRTQTPSFEDTFSVRTRQWNATLGTYLPAQANAYSIKRFMPAPYLLQVKVDIVTSNTQQKLQILEQILPLFNPSLELQKTDNYLDWESLSYLELQDVTWSNRTIPVGQNSDSSYDVCTLTFEAPIWMSLPAKVNKMGVIFKVIMNIGDTSDLSDMVYGTRQVITFNNYGLFAANGQLRIMKEGANDPVDNINVLPTLTSNVVDIDQINNHQTAFLDLYSQPLEWTGILAAYGKIRDGVSMIGLSYDNSQNEILGTITVNPIDPTVLLYNVNIATLPSNTISSINMIVNPQEVSPGNGLANSSIGDSYLLTSNIGSAWPYDTVNSSAHAQENDIITYNGNAWVTTFLSSNNQSNIQFVFDNSSNVQYKWNGIEWIRGWEGYYNNANWRMII
jgi:hypothetical protein